MGMSKTALALILVAVVTIIVATGGMIVFLVFSKTNSQLPSHNNTTPATETTSIDDKNMPSTEPTNAFDRNRISRSILDTRKCGKRYADIQARITNGTDASLGSAPWFVSLVIHVDLPERLRFEQHICGGSIISEQWVLTATHCLSQQKRRINCEKNCKIVAGSIKRNNTGYSFGTEHKIVEEVPFHKDYEYIHSNDIALLKVSPPFKYRPPGKIGERAIGPICLPEQDEPITEKEGYIYGFGGTNDTMLRMAENNEIRAIDDDDRAKLLVLSENLQSAQVNVISRNECAKLTDDKVDESIVETGGKNWRNILLNTNAVICAGNIEETKFSCFGDSGGPLTIEKHGKETLIGVAHLSLTNTCVVKPVWYNVFIRVSNFRDWINRITGV